MSHIHEYQPMWALQLQSIILSIGESLYGPSPGTFLLGGFCFSSSEDSKPTDIKQPFKLIINSTNIMNCIGWDVGESLPPVALDFGTLS